MRSASHTAHRFSHGGIVMASLLSHIPYTKLFRIAALSVLLAKIIIAEETAVAPKTLRNLLSRLCHNHGYLFRRYPWSQLV